MAPVSTAVYTPWIIRPAPVLPRGSSGQPPVSHGGDVFKRCFQIFQLAGPVAVTVDRHGRAENGGGAREGKRNHELVPAGEASTGPGGEGHGDDRGTGQCRQRHYPGLGLAARSAGSVRDDGDVLTGAQGVAQGS